MRTPQEINIPEGTKDIVAYVGNEQLKDVVQEIAPILLCKDLFFIITERELDKFIVGEIEARQTIFLCAMGMFVSNANIASYNLLVNDLAGVGKDYVTGKTLSMLPDNKHIKRTRISPTVFTYWHNSHFEPNWTWDGKTLYLEDVSNGVLNSPVFKVMCSSGSNTTIVKDQKAVDIKINGKPVMIITSATASPIPELVRRFTILNLDSGINQTEEIVKRHLEYAENGQTPEIDKTIPEALYNLHRVKVKIPFAKKLYKFVPKNSVIMRTHIMRFLDYIKASAALYQYQRVKDEEGFIIATEQDYKIARITINKTTSNQYMIPLTKDQRRILDVLKQMPDEWKEVSDLLVKINWMSEKWLREQLDRLVEYNLLLKDNTQTLESKRKVFVYMYQDIDKIQLPEAINE